MECRKLEGVTTEERFLTFLEEFQRASRFPIFVLHSFSCDYWKCEASDQPLSHPLLALLDGRNYVKRQVTWFRNKGQSEQLFNWTDATQPLVSDVSLYFYNVVFCRETGLDKLILLKKIGFKSSQII